MSERNRIVGKGHYTISNLVPKLSSSGSFHLLFDKWEDVAYSLGVSQVVIKKRKLDFSLNKDSLKYVITELLESWVGEKDNEAYLEDLLKALKENGMEALAEHIRGETDCVNKQPKKYSRVPQSLKEFFYSKGKQYTIITTPDISITCQKIRENCENSKILEVKGFFTEVSKDRDATTDKRSPYVITVIKLDEVEKVFKSTTEFPVEKLLIITREPEEKLNEFAGKLKIVKDEMDWDDLTPIFRLEIEVRLTEQVGMNIQNLSKTVCGQILVDLINKVELKLFENTIPEELLVSYYISREIIERTELDKQKLFDSKSKTDIFLFTGIDKIKLRSYVKSGMTGISSELLHSKVNEDLRFVELKNPMHFPKICHKNSDKSVHWIKLEDEEFHWVKTCGDMKSIQEMIKTKPIEEVLEDEDAYKDMDEEEIEDEKFREASLVTKVTLNDAARVVCLSDTPGMGKSVLLAKIGKQLKDIPDSSKIVIFLPISDVTKSIKELDKKNLESAIHELACKNNLEKEIISERLTSSALEIELLLDGFDEVESERIDLALELLQFIQTLSSIRLWVGTRPQHLQRLEQELKTIGYNIKPFNKMEQVKFLKMYWTRRNQDLNKNLLKIFARKVLETLASTTDKGTRGSAKEMAIAGVPLQCHMLAQIYEESAALFCSSDENNAENIPVLLDINSVTALYEALVENKFKKYQKTYSGQDKLDTRKLYLMHSKLAFQLIFPDWFDENIAHLFKETVETEELLNVGLLERKSSGSTSFIHQTYAEYFCAHFVAEMISKKDFLNEPFIKFFYNGFLTFANPAETSDHEYSLKFIFRKLVPCYFLDCLIFNNTDALSNVTASKDISPDEIQTFIFACSNNNFQSLFNLFAEHPHFKKHVNVIIDERFLLYSIKNHGFEMYKMIHGHFKGHSEFSARLSSKALHTAVGSVDPAKLEYFLNIEGLISKLLGNPGFELNRLFKSYFGSSSKESSNAIEVINLLVGLEERIAESEDFDYDSLELQKSRNHWRLVLLNQHVDYRIGVELIKWGADIPQADEGINFLQMQASANEEFLQYLQALLTKYSSEEIQPLIEIKNVDGLTPLACAFRNKVQFSRECMELWKQAGVDFTEVFNNAPLFLFAIQSGNGREVLQFMIENGVDVQWRKGQENNGRLEVRTYLDYAADAGNLDAIQLLVDEHGMDVNGVNENVGSLLDNLILNWKNNSESYFRGAQELWKLGGRFKITSHNDLRQIVAQHRDLYLLRFALICGLEVNKGDMDGNNLLHWVIVKWPDDEAIEITLEAGANLSAKNEEGLTPLDLAVKSIRNIEIIRFLKPSKNFRWSSISPMVSFDCFESILCRSANIISDLDEFLPLLQEFIKRNSGRNPCLISLLDRKYKSSPIQFHFMTEYLAKNKNLVHLLTTPDEKGAAALHHAIKNINGIAEKTIKILQRIVNLKLKDGKDKSLLFYAVEGGQSPEFLEVLNKYGGGDFHDKDINGQNLLHALAATLDDEEIPLEMIKFLLQKRVGPNGVDVDGNTPLHCCLKKIVNLSRRVQHRKQHAKDLLKRKAKPEIKKDNDFFRHYTRVLKGPIEFSKALLEGGANPEIKNNEGVTFIDLLLYPATKAEVNQARQILKLILDFTNNISFISSNFSLDDIAKWAFGTTSSKKDNLTDEEFIYFTKKILELKTEMKSDWAEDYFPLENWKRFLKPKNLHLLVENLIENRQAETFFLLTENGTPVLHHVVSAITVEERTLQLLREKGINLGVKDERDWSLLFHAINRNGITLKEFKMLENYGGGKMRDKDASEKGLLHVAVNLAGREVDNSNLIEYLLVKVGLDPNEIDNEDNTPLHILFEDPYALWNNEAIPKVQAFVEAGAITSEENSKGETVSGLADGLCDYGDNRKDYLLSILPA